MRNKLFFVPLLFVATFTACTPTNSGSQSKNTSEEYETITRLSIPLERFFEQEEEEYLVFCHSDTCSQCKEIIGDVVAFANDNFIKTYFLDVAVSTNKITKVAKAELTVGVTDVAGLVYAGTPTIFKVVNKTTTVNIPGKDDCLTFLNEIRKNSKN